MLGLTTYNHKAIKQKNLEILVLQEKQDNLQNSVIQLKDTIVVAKTQMDATDKAYKALSEKLANLDKNKEHYTNKVKEIRDENEDARKLLDTRLPDDLKRLLNEAVQGGKQ